MQECSVRTFELFPALLTNLLTNFQPLSLSVKTSSVSTKYLLYHFYPHIQSPRLIKTFEVETSWVFTLPVVYFARIIDFRSYVDATMSLYSIIKIM